MDISINKMRDHCSLFPSFRSTRNLFFMSFSDVPPPTVVTVTASREKMPVAQIAPGLVPAYCPIHHAMGYLSDQLSIMWSSTAMRAIVKATSHCPKLPLPKYLATLVDVSWGRMGTTTTSSETPTPLQSDRKAEFNSWLVLQLSRRMATAGPQDLVMLNKVLLLTHDLMCQGAP
jgi:hypothetical protein